LLIGRCMMEEAIFPYRNTECMCSALHRKHRSNSFVGKNRP
jgi:hypothetical protein